MLSAPTSASPYTSATPVDICDTWAGVVTPLLTTAAGLDAAIDLLGWVQVAILNADQRGQRTWHAPRPPRSTDGRRLAALPCWTSRQAWTAAVSAMLSTEDGRAVLRRHRVAAARVIAFARACAAFAESHTGRHMTAALSTLRERADISQPQAERSRRVLTAIGAQVQISAGRHLTGIEIMAARAHHGGRQRAVASEYALVMPNHLIGLVEPAQPLSDAALATPSTTDTTAREQRPSCAPLSPLGDRSISSLEIRGSLKTPSSQKRPHQQRRARTYRRSTPRPLALQRLAAQLITRMHSIDQPGQHLGRICDVLSTCGVDPTRWTAIEVRAALDHDARTTGLSWPDHVTSPTGYLAWRLRRIDWTAPTPTEQDRAERERSRRVLAEHSPTAPTTPAASAETRAAARAAFAEAHAMKSKKAIPVLTASHGYLGAPRRALGTNSHGARIRRPNDDRSTDPHRGQP